MKARKMDSTGYVYWGLAAVCAAALLILPAKGASANATKDSLAPSQPQAAEQSSTQSSAKPNLAGTWKLNKDQSDDPRQKMRDAMGGASKQGEAGGGGGEKREPGTGRPGRGPGPGGGMMAEWSQLTIAQTDAGVKVTGASGRLLATSQAESKQDNDNNGGMGERHFQPAVAEWQGSQLVAKGHGFGGGTTTRTFELSPDGKQLYVTTKLESEWLSQPVTYKLVYDAGKAESNSQ